MRDSIDAVVLAGGSGESKIPGFPVKALVDLAGRPMVQYVIEALLATPRVGRVMVVGAQELQEQGWAFDKPVDFIPGGASMIESIGLGLQSLQGDPQQPVLLVSGDVPLLTPGGIEYFLDGCAAKPGDFYYPIIPRESIEARFPGMVRTYVTLRDGVFTGGNLVLVRPRTVKVCAEKAQDFIALRKRPLALGRLLGWSFLFKLLLRRLTVEEARCKVSDLFGMVGEVLIIPAPEIGVDVDKPDDLEWMRREFANRV